MAVKSDTPTRRIPQPLAGRLAKAAADYAEKEEKRGYKCEFQAVAYTDGTYDILIREQFPWGEHEVSAAKLIEEAKLKKLALEYFTAEKVRSDFFDAQSRPESADVDTPDEEVVASWDASTRGMYEALDRIVVATWQKLLGVAKKAYNADPDWYAQYVLADLLGMDADIILNEWPIIGDAVLAEAEKAEKS